MASDPKKSVSVPIAVRLPEAGEDTLKQLQAVLYGRTGSVLGATRLEVSRDGDTLVAKGTINVPEAALGQTVRLTVAPVLDASGKEPMPSRAKLEKQLAAYTEPLRLDRQRPTIELAIARPYWQLWPRLCFCWVRGRLVKRVTLPDGSTIDLPICNARVTVCEVDRWAYWINRLPDRDILRLRDDLLGIVRGPIKPPIPEPDPEPFPGPYPGLRNPAPIARLAGASSNGVSNRGVAQALRGRQAIVRSLDGVTLDDFKLDRLEVPEWNRLAQGPAPLARQWLVADALYWRPWLCELAWLEPWFLTFKQCFATVPTDENGRFSALYIHACNGDQPDIYVSAEQLIGGVWTSIYAPSVRCHTHWNYVCGSELTIVVTDPRAQPCVPEPPVEPPSGVERWVLPHAIGGTFIGGTAGVGIPAGWVRPDGLTSYGSFVDAPFGSVLGFRQQHAISIPDAGVYYYRWSWRRGTSGSFTAMTEPVSRNYVRDVPGPGLAFPTVQLGPTLGDRFRFRTQIFNPADWGVDTSTDPAGTQYYWPIDGAVGDIYSARWVTPGTGDAVAAPALADSYQVKLEVFSQANALVVPGPATFQFLLPTSIEADGTINTRVAAPSELDAGGLVFTVVVDNSRCSAGIDPPVLSAGMADDDCGFLRYADGASLQLEFTATHPNDRAVFSFAVIRGATFVAAASTSGEVASSAPPYALAGGEYSHSFPVATLLDTCPSAAFAADLYVTAKATNGNARLSEYDRAALRAFALAEGG